jgi:predicted outer membrane repeat protein
MLLLGSILSADTIPGGDVSGTWYASNSPYYVTGNITIPASDTLVIEPGVLVDFLGGYSFTANGVLEALGTASDSIHFFSEDTVAGWSRIICGDVCDSLQLSYCTVSYADCGIEACVGLTSVSISHCRFSRNTRALEWMAITSLQIDDCAFRDNGSAEYGAAITIWLAYGPVQITGCRFENNAALTGGAILISQWYDNNIRISDCTFLNNTAELKGGAIAAYEMPNPASLIIENCTFAENTAYGMNNDLGGGAIWASNLPDFTISYCCFYDNSAYVGSAINLAPTWGNCNLDLDHCTFRSQEIFGIGSSNTILDVSNCIFTDAEYAIANHTNITLTVLYSDFHNNDVDIQHPPAGFGVLDRVNYNGDSCDCYYDIFMDPMFVDTVNNNYHLTENSPCIDAGDPLFAYDPDSTITDMGAYYFEQRPPEIHLPLSLLDFGTVSVGDSSSLSLFIYNVGYRNLILYDLTNALSVFTNDWDPADSIIMPGDSLLVMVTFTPDDSIAFTDTLWIDNNDTLAYVELVGVGEPPSGIAEDIPSAGTPRLELLGSNIFRDKITFSLVGEWEHQGIGAPDLKIYDISGRLMREMSLAPCGLSIGAQATWDGKDGEGRAVRAGIYFVGVNGLIQQKVVKIR